jgi:hypothetical protein
MENVVPLRISFENALWMYGQILLSEKGGGKDQALLGLRREGRRLDHLSNAIMELAETYGSNGELVLAVERFLEAVRVANKEATHG